MDILGVRTSHSEIIFTATEPRQTYRTTLTVLNISSVSRMVIVRPSKSKLFRIIAKKNNKKIAPGVQISVIIEFSTTKAVDASDVCTIGIDEDIITIPLHAFTAACDLSVDREVDFGTVVADSRVIFKEICVTNNGSLSGRFAIASPRNQFMTILPRNGTVQPKNVFLIKVELYTYQPMVLDEMIKMRLEDAEDTVVKIKGNIVVPTLELIDFSGQKLECIQFGSAYYGTSKLEQIFVYNNSPEFINWVTLMENDAVGSEVGTDLSLSSEAFLADKLKEDYRPTAYTSDLIACQPCEGILNPYSKIIVTLCFSPKEFPATKFHKKEDEIPKFREYALYVRFETVRSCDIFPSQQKLSNESDGRKGQQRVEVALTGIGCPVNLNIGPVSKFDFMECFLGEKVNVKGILRNDSHLLPLNFQFRQMAHFRVTPAKGDLKPGQSMEVVISFAAHQLGKVEINQVIDFFGLVAFPNNPVELKMELFHQTKIPFTGVCNSPVKKPKANHMPGKETDHSAEQMTGKISKMRELSPDTLLTGCESVYSRKKKNKSATGMKHHTCVDSEYTYDDKEVETMKARKKYYERYVQGLRIRRLQKQDHREFDEFNNAVDIGIRPAEGLRSPKLSAKDIVHEKLVTDVCAAVPPIRIRKLKVKGVPPLSKPAEFGLNAVPSSLQEEMGCSLTLTPQQLHQIFIGPSTVDYGKVCVHSTSTQKLNIVNNLATHILIEVDTVCVELRESSPLSQVVPPMSTAYLPLVFGSIIKGPFQKSITYRINNVHSGRILVMASVVSVELELSTNELVLSPNYGLLHESGMRTTVRLYNRRNYSAQFSWIPVLTEDGMAFFIRPDGGVVDAFNDLECEVVWHASFFSPVKGDFDLIVHEGNKIRLKCAVELGHINVHFVENRVLFNSAALNISVTKIAVIKNQGQNHAYFKVSNENCVPGMTVIPTHGVIPVGGFTCLNIFFHPTTIFKFDTRLKVDIRNSNMLKLRVGGSVIQPMAEINLKYFMFYGIYCGATSVIPFTLLNLIESPIKIEFDFSHYKDFSLKFEASADAIQDPVNPHLFVANLRGKESIKCELFFTPTQVASYYFNLPVNINGSPSPSPPPSSIPPDPYEEMASDSSSVQLQSPTPSHKVKATALYPPIELSTTKVEFSLMPGYNDLGVIAADPFVQKIEIQNTSKKEVTWLLDINSQENKALDEGIFRIYNYNGSLQPGQRHCITIGFCPSYPGNYSIEIPMFINEEKTIRYRVISVTGVIHTSKMIIDPPFVNLHPVPLNTETRATVQISCINCLSDCTIKAEIPEVENEDGNWFQPISCEFPEGSSSLCVNGTNKSITCNIAFCSFTPISISVDVIFIDQDQNRLKLPISASADNCLLTLYRYVGVHQADQQIVLKTATTSTNYPSDGKVILQPYYSPGTSLSSSTLTAFSTVSSYFPDSSPGTTGTSKMDKGSEVSDREFLGVTNNWKKLMFFDEDVFCQKVLTAIQVWVSLFGWPNGMNPISIPESLRRINHAEGNKTILCAEPSKWPSFAWSDSKPLLPSDPVECILQLHCTIQHFSFPKHCLQNTESTNIFDLNEDVFESISKRSWTDILLQIYKVFVLSRLTVKDINNMHSNLRCLESLPRINADPLSSNVYSIGERVLLTWLNFHYESMRKSVWACSTKGAAPPTRWIINFDLDLLDGLVLAAVLAAYCPDVIPTYLENMFTCPSTPEQCLHNSLVLLNAFNAIGLDFDIQATDISDPNPIMMLMLCVYLYDRLPNYLLTKNVEFVGELHATIVKKIRLQNQIDKRLVYFATIVGKDARHFSLPDGNKVSIASRNYVDVTVEFTSRFLEPVQALLVFVSRLKKGIVCATRTFSLISQVNKMNPTASIKCESPCYEQKIIQMNVTNPLKEMGVFRVILMEHHNALFKTEEFKCIAALLTKLKTQTGKWNARPGEFENGKEIENGADDPNVNLKTTLQDNWVPEFFTQVESLHMEAQGSSVMDVLYLPFHTGNSHCTIFFVNERVGEFAYCLEGTGSIPLPATGLQVLSSRAIQNHCFASDDKNTSQVIMYYKCNIACSFDQVLKIPLINEAREKALAIVGQRWMSEIEYKRRKVAGTLESSSVRASVATIVLHDSELKISHSPGKYCKNPRCVDYTIELSAPKHFECPDTVSVPIIRVHRGNFKSHLKPGGLNFSEIDEEASSSLPMKFVSEGPGHYPCKILLQSKYDVRLYNILCVVNPEEFFETELEIAASTHQSVIKNIHLYNDTQEDWTILAVLEGKGFFGPSMLIIRACETSMYPLMFKPDFESMTMGKLVLTNQTDGTERIFNLKGIGKSPVAMDHIVIDCQVRQIAKKVLSVPNYTQTKLTCKVVSDLSIVSGVPHVTLKAGQTVPYEINILPWKQGNFTGVISFVAGDDTLQQGQLPVSSGTVEKPVMNVTSMAAETTGDTNSAKNNKIYRIWFYLEIHSVPGPPEQSFGVTCAVQESIDVKIVITNPIDEPLTLDVILNGDGITGDTCLVVKPKETISYVARFAPSIVGETIGSVTFYSDLIGEFWYKLNLVAKKPTPLTLPELQCELGKWARQFIPLANSSIETLKLKFVNSNPTNFSVEIDPRKEIIVNPLTTTEVPVQFFPSTLGKGNHSATIIFKCPQLQEWTFHLSGIGLLPLQMDPVSITTCVNSHASVIVPFKNPTDDYLLVDVVLTDDEQITHNKSPADLLQSINKHVVFCIPLKQSRDILLPPKEKLDIPLIFAPEYMTMYEGLIVVQIKKQDGSTWPCALPNVTTEEIRSFCRSEKGEISAIRWLYPINGIPEALPAKRPPAVIQCQAQQRIEKTIEIILTGAVPGSAQTAIMEDETDISCTCEEEIQETNRQSIGDEFFYEMLYETEEVRAHMEPTVAISFVKKEWDTQTGIVMLTFNVVFAPFTPVKQTVMLKVQSVTGGVWKFPLHLTATEPQVDDIINIETTGLNKESIVCFRLTSQTRNPIPFTALFLPCSDPEFVVSPQTGELLPLGTTGTLITIGFIPRMYSKKYKARLLIQTTDMQWIYELNGLDPQYSPPNLQHGKVITSRFRHSVPVRQRNFIRENLKVIATAVSSPLKGAPLVTLSKTSRAK
ncbi:cilia- and flagella-associated protein 47 [Amblyraja radiata]|uniref:cilia- and flagella-associated protein 47 n=1 Tax=Amblyraja radiata TaxID=386614 RepID=UPI00140242AB|nr:cilia- and flagella-associated protein 47 [Amblyraja radiata]